MAAVTTVALPGHTRQSVSEERFHCNNPLGGLFLGTLVTSYLTLAAVPFATHVVLEEMFRATEEKIRATAVEEPVYLQLGSHAIMAPIRSHAPILCRAIENLAELPLPQTQSTTDVVVLTISDVIAFIRSLLTYAKAPLKAAEEQRTTHPFQYIPEGGNQATTTLEDLRRTGKYFPGKLPLREWTGRRFDKDKDPKGRKRTRRAPQTEDERSCKKSIKHNSASPGVMIYYCLEHGSVLGFEVMRECESAKTIFSTLNERWAEAPEAIVYDNACGAHKYFNYRSDWFKLTKFIIDRLHWGSHVNCIEVHNPVHFGEFKSFNTQLCEQINMSLKKQQKQMYHFGRDMFYFHLMVDVYTANRSRRTERARCQGQLRKRTTKSMQRYFDD